MRNNEWYWHLLKMLPGNLLDIPWARTGKLYLQRGGAHDDRSSIHHSYGIWLRNQLKDLVVERVKSKTIRELGIFNDHGLDNALKAWLKARTKTTNSLDEVLSWLSSLHVFIERNGIGLKCKHEQCIVDRLAAIKGRTYAESYILARNWMRQ